MSSIAKRITLKAPPDEIKHVLEEIKKPKKVDTHVKLLVYGVIGMGKTRFCCSAAALEHMRPVFVVDCKGGLESTLEWSEYFTSYRPTTWDQLLATIECARKNYKTIIIDDFEALYNGLLMASIMRQVVRAHPDRDEAVPSQREYLIALKLCDALLTVLMADDLHLLTNIVDKQSGSDRDFPTPIRPALPGQAANLVCKTLSTVLHIRAVKPSKASMSVGRAVDFQYHSQATSRFFAKTRTLIKNPLVNPTFADYYAEWERARREVIVKTTRPVK